jgi:VanZ family protein
MSNRAREIRFWLKAWLPVAAAVGLVAIESTTYFGADHTNGPLRSIWEWLFGPVTNHHWHYIHLAIRKSGHFAGFGLVGLTWLRAWRITMPRARFVRVELCALIGTALIATADEFHQSFLPNRTSSPRDVLLDCIGAFTMMCIVHLFLKVRAPEKLARAA